MTTDRREIIENEIVELMKAEGLEDTPAIRRDILLGIRDAWLEDPSSSIEKSLYMLTINLMITNVSVQLLLQK